MEGTPSDSLFSRLTSASGAIAAVTVAALYLGGMTTLMVRMDKAGLVSQDILPLFSLEQLLRVGLTWVYPVVPTLLVLAVLYAASVYFERGLSKGCLSFEAEWAEGLDPEKRDQWVASFTKIRVSTDWEKAKAELNKAIDERPGDPHLRKWKGLRGKIRLFTVWAVVVFLVLFGACALLPAALGIAAWAVILVVAVLVSVRPAQQELLPIIAVVAIAYLASAIVDPRPLPLATVTTQHPVSRVSGDLVVVSDATWYLTNGRGGVRAIPADDITHADLLPRHRSETLLDAMVSEIVS